MRFIPSWKSLKIRMQSSGSAVGAVVMAFVLGFGLHWLLSGAEPLAPGEAATHQHGPDEAAMWTCSMHPQIQQPQPGKCPLCGMDLIPVTSSPGEMTNLRQISVSEAAKALMNIQTTPVQRRYVTATVRLVGKVAYDETRLSYITARVPGRLDRLYVDYTGVRVNKGDHMVYIYSPELYAAQQELIEAVKARRQSSQTPNRFLSGGIDLVESAREKLRLWGLTKEQIDEIARRDKPSDHLTLYAPMSGIVVHKNRQEGDYVNVGERIYAVADLTQVWVQLDAYESDLPWLRYGQEVTFTTEAYPGDEFRGQIAFIDPVLNDQTRTVKIRVNVPNPEGKLKPEMFVRGIVRAQVAAGGRVIDADLAGKWISPMHPEIVKDQPGHCDICGMPLVRAESLGYISTNEYRETAPLVIPASAVLLTGTRAIVYVAVPDAEQPTYVGREVVLGPRAGDYYQVASGLDEGELVVTHGNFKLDSALQIQAKPSMMTPEGGGGGGHQHGESHPAGTDLAASDTVPATGVPAEFHAQWKALDAAYADVTQATASHDLSQIRATFRQFGEAVRNVDEELLTGHSRMLWQEFDMRLANDAVEGARVNDVESANRLVRHLTETMRRAREELGAPAHADHGGHPQRLDASPAFQADLAKIWKAYVSGQQALAADDLAASNQAVADLQRAVAQVDSQTLSGEALDVWKKEKSNLDAILRMMQKNDNLRALREEFAPLSAEMEVLIQRFGLGGASPVYRVHCPMAFDDLGASWLQDSDQPLNPYFGSAMLKCHDRMQKIASGPENAAPATEH